MSPQPVSLLTPMAHTVAHIYWPRSLKLSGAGFLAGYNVHSLVVVVVAVLPVQTLRDAEAALAALPPAPGPAPRAPLTLLGTVGLRVLHPDAGVWVHVGARHEVWCCGYRYQAQPLLLCFDAPPIAYSHAALDDLLAHVHAAARMRLAWDAPVHAVHADTDADAPVSAASAAFARLAAPFAALLALLTGPFVACSTLATRVRGKAATFSARSSENALLCAMLDSLLGVACLLTCAPQLTVTLTAALHWLRSAYFESGIAWLMGWPSGVKLNAQLDLFLGHLFRIYLAHWDALCDASSALVQPLLFPLTVCVGALGLSVLAALVADVLSFATLHVYWLFSALDKALHLQLRGIQSLWLLFRGQKRNVLKRRLDNQAYALDQLLLGTLLFCVLVFLLPTLASYWCLFFLARAAVITLQATLRVTMCAVACWPLLPLCRHVAQATRRGGVRFSLCAAGASCELSASGVHVHVLPNPATGLRHVLAPWLRDLHEAMRA